MSATGGWLSGFKRPEYVGENRCVPCTAVNLAIAAVITVLIGLGITRVSGLTVGVGVAAAVALVFLVAIYLRGYLLPGTPELTKRYLPQWILAWFGKTATDHVEIEADDEFDPEAALVEIGVLEECRDRPDLCMTDEFRDAWNQAIADVDETADRDRLLSVMNVESGEVTLHNFGDAFRARLDGVMVGSWESEPAYLADLAGAALLEERHPDWENLAVLERSRLIRGLRLFIDRCPGCGGSPEFGMGTVESCCSAQEVAAVTCQDCGARLFESVQL